MTKEQILALFPLKGEVTQEILDNADIHDTGNCRGAQALKAALGDNLQYFDEHNMWGTTYGRVYLKDGNTFRLTTEEGYEFMHGITAPCIVTFIVSDRMEHTEKKVIEVNEEV